MKSSVKGTMSQTPSRPTPMARRLLLRALAGLSVVAALPGWAWSFFVPRLHVRTVEKRQFKFDPASGQVRPRRGEGGRPYALKVEGLVDKPLSLSYADLKALPQVEQASDFHCVEGWSVADLKWGGFRLEELFKLAGPQPQATHAVFHSLGQTEGSPQGQSHYVESFPLSELRDPARGILLALRLGGQPLPDQHGAPLRLVAPLDLGYKSIKFVERVELSAGPRPGWWTLANPIYPIVARVPAKRLRRPKP